MHPVENKKAVEIPQPSGNKKRTVALRVPQSLS
jgi:hypothetical protein